MTIDGHPTGPRLASSYWAAVDSDLVVEHTVGSLLREAAERAPATTALVEGLPAPEDRRRWTYAELLDEAEATARALLQRFSPGERIAVWANNIPEWVLLQMGAALAGLTLVTVDPALRSAELRHVLGQSRAAGVFLRTEYRDNPMAATLEGIRSALPHLREAVLFDDWDAFRASGVPTQELPAVSPDDPVQIQYTSGTTGTPKGAVLRHRGQVNNARLSYARLLDMRPGEAWLNTMPMFHTAGSVLATLAPIASLGTHVLMPWFDPALFLRLLAEERSAIFGGVPTMLLALLAHPDLATTDTSSVRVALTGGATCPPDLARRLESTLGVPMAIIYAQTEASPGITMTRPFEDGPKDRTETLGRPLPATEVAVLDPVDRRSIVPPGTTGEMCTRGYHVMIGYFDDPAQTATAIDGDGWLHTGDLASMDERGYCRIEGRLKEMIIRGGENVFPREIEHALLGHPGVHDVAVLGVPDERWGEQIAAFVVPAPGADVGEDALTQYCRDRLARHKVPRIWRFVDRFPTTGSGKIQKFPLLESLASDPG
jgi:fatty-acyl-CoA synthase